jgi:hypothetical protein
MPYRFVDDGYPESVEFENNYVRLDPRHPVALYSRLRRPGPPPADTAGRGASTRWKKIRSFFQSLGNAERRRGAALRKATALSLADYCNWTRYAFAPDGT